VTKVLSTEEAKRAIEGSGKDFGKSRFPAVSGKVDGNFVSENIQNFFGYEVPINLSGHGRKPRRFTIGENSRVSGFP
jgi:hypothetical protein